MRLLAVSGVVMASVPAAAETQIGSADRVVKDVTGKLGAAVRTIAVSDQVFQNDLIETKQRSATELVFLDGTKISVGPSAKLVLDEFVYNPSDKTGTFKMSMFQGAARFVSGNLSNKKKANFEIKTPTVTIGVRGTTLNIVVDKSGATATELASLSNVDVANGLGDVVGLDQPNTAVTSTPAGAFTDGDSLPAWAVAAIQELNGLLRQDISPFEAFAVPGLAPAAPAPAPAPAVAALAAPDEPAPAPAEPAGLGLDQAQAVASETALGGGLGNNAVGVADQSAQGLGQHGGPGGGTDSGTGGGTGGSDGGDGSDGTGGVGAAAAAADDGTGDTGGAGGNGNGNSGGNGNGSNGAGNGNGNGNSGNGAGNSGGNGGAAGGGGGGQE